MWSGRRKSGWPHPGMGLERGRTVDAVPSREPPVVPPGGARHLPGGGCRKEERCRMCGLGCPAAVWPCRLDFEAPPAVAGANPSYAVGPHSGDGRWRNIRRRSGRRFSASGAVSGRFFRKQAGRYSPGASDSCGPCCPMPERTVGRRSSSSFGMAAGTALSDARSVGFPDFGDMRPFRGAVSRRCLP